MKCPRHNKRFLWWKWKGKHEPKHVKIIGTRIDHYHIERKCIHCDVLMGKLEYISEIEMQAMGYDILKLRKLDHDEEADPKELLNLDEILLGDS